MKKKRVKMVFKCSPEQGMAALLVKACPKGTSHLVSLNRRGTRAVAVFE